MKATEKLHNLGQSLWLDNITRGLLTSGTLNRYIADFSITGGRERWLYRVARKHAGGNGSDGFAISMQTLFDKSGAEGPYIFEFRLSKIPNP